MTAGITEYLTNCDCGYRRIADKSEPSLRRFPAIVADVLIKVTGEKTHGRPLLQKGNPLSQPPTRFWMCPNEHSCKNIVAIVNESCLQNVRNF